MRSALYARAFPNTRISAGKDTELEVMTTARGFRLATSVGGTLTGRGGNLLIIDDPLKPQDAQSETARDTVWQWYTNTLLSRLDNKAEDRAAAFRSAVRRTGSATVIAVRLVGLGSPSPEPGA